MTKASLKTSSREERLKKPNPERRKYVDRIVQNAKALRATGCVWCGSARPTLKAGKYGGLFKGKNEPGAHHPKCAAAWFRNLKRRGM